MRQLKIGQVKLPKVYVADNSADADKCRELGVPYLVMPEGWDDEKLAKVVLWRTLVKMFPHINWHKTLRIRKVTIESAPVVHVPSTHRTNGGEPPEFPSTPYMEVSDDYRTTDGGMDDDFDMDGYQSAATIDDYVGDLGWCVDVEQLQSLHLLPTFLDDIATAVKRNLASVAWMDGYNKKLGCNVGSYNGGSDADNLIVLDVSASVPSGVAGTMVSLIETLRHQAQADLIITSWESGYWKANEKLPDPDNLAAYIGGCNECVQFYRILKEHVLGKHWGNVIIFGDNDAPDADRFRKYRDTWLVPNDLQSTRIDRIMAFHTYADVVPGYGLWAKDAAPRAEIVYNHDWVQFMKGRY